MATRTGPGDTTTELTLTSCTVDLRRGGVDYGGDPRKLTTRECAMLAYLAARPGEVVTRSELLVEVWGYAPDTISRTVDTTARRLRAKIERDPSDPDHILTVQGEGYRFEVSGSANVHLRTLPTADVSPAAAVSGTEHYPSAAAGRTNIGPGEGSFVGRDDDLAALASIFAGGARLVTLMGPGGTGKTRLSRAFGARGAAAGTFAGAWFCDLVATRTEGAVAAAMESLLGVAATDDEAETAARLDHAIRGRGRCLIVLDNFEQVAAAAAGTVGRWLEAAPEARFLVTSRERLQLAGEHVLDLAPLAVDAAVQLFEDRARAARASFTLDAAARAVVADVVERLDRLPLAIELAAARVTVLSVSALRTQLDKRFRLLVARRRDLTERQRTMRGAIAWSWDLLSEAERLTLASCSVFRGSFGADAADTVVDLSGLDDGADEWVIDVLEALRDKSLVRAVPDAGGETRLQLLESIRHFAADRLDALEITEDVAARHRDHYLAVSEGAPLAALVAERDNLLAAHRRYAGFGPAPTSPRLRKIPSDPDGFAAAEAAHHEEKIARVRLALVLDDLLARHGPHDIHLQVLDDAVEAADGLPEPWPARARVARAARRRLRGDPSGAQDDLDVAMALLGAVGGTQSTATALPALAARARLVGGQLASQGGRPEQAEAAFQSAVRWAERAKDAGLRVRARYALGLLYRDHGRRDEAAAIYREVLADATDLGDRLHQGLAHGGLGVLAIGRADAAEADEHLRASLAIQRELGDRRAEAVALGNLGLFHSHQGRAEEAAAAYADGSVAAREVGDLRLEALLLRNLAILRLSLGRLGHSEADFERALGIHRRMGDRWQEGRCLVELAEVMVQRDLLGRAEELYRAGLVIAEELDDREGRGLARGNLGVLAHLRGDLDEAYSLNVAAMEDLSRPQDVWLGCYYMAYGCPLRVERGDAAEAAAVLEDARSHVTRLNDLAGMALVDAAAGALEIAAARAAGADAGAVAAIVDAVRARVAASGQDEESHAVRVGVRLLERFAADQGP